MTDIKSATGDAAESATSGTVRPTVRPTKAAMLKAGRALKMDDPYTLRGDVLKAWIKNPSGVVGPEGKLIPGAYRVFIPYETNYMEPAGECCTFFQSREWPIENWKILFGEF